MEELVIKSMFDNMGHEVIVPGRDFLVSAMNKVAKKEGEGCFMVYKGKSGDPYLQFWVDKGELSTVASAI